MAICLGILDRGRIGIAARELVLLPQHLEATEYAKERKQFGGPIINNQELAGKLADIIHNWERRSY